MFFWGFLLGVLCTIALLKLLHEFSPDIWIFRWMTEKSLLMEEVEESGEPEEVELETINSPEINLGDSAEIPRLPDDEVRENSDTSELQSKKERLLHTVASVHEGLSDSTSPDTSQSSDEEIFQHPRPSKPPSEVDIQPSVRQSEPKTVPSNPPSTELASPLYLVKYNPASLQVAPEVFSGWLKIRSKVVVGGQLVWHKRFFSLKADGWLSYYTTEKKRSDQLHGWINLHGCQVQCYVKEKSSTKKVFKILVKHSDNKIWHRHGPDPLIPPVPRKRNLSMRSRKCRLKALDEATYLQWMIQLQTIVDKVTGSFIPSRVTSHETPSAGTERITKSPPAVGEPQISVTEYVPSTAAVSEPVVEMPPVVVPQPASTSGLRVSVSLVGTQEASQPVVAVVSPAPIPTSSSTSQIMRKSREFAIADTATEDTPDDRVFDADNRRGLLKELTKAATGLDLVHISLPVSLNEPFSFLQKMCEQIGYWELLDKADTCEDSCHRLLYTSAFVISQYCFDRTTKPFNPLLGETFEYVQEGKIRFISEQVSHHPPVGASYAFNSHFEYSQHQGVKTRFGGNSIPCEEIGMKHLKLKTHGDVFDWPGVKTVVHNVILGRLWIDHFGDLELVNKTTGDRSKIEFKECGWFSKGRWEVSGSIYDVDGKLRISFKGKRNEYITATVILGTELPENANPIWKHNKLQSEQNDPWKMSAFAQELNEVDGFLDQILPDTDSRFRPDRAALQKQDLKRAAAEKRLLEQKQRDQAKMRATTGRTWTPRYFEKTEEQNHNFECWKFKGNYWEERDKRLAQFNRRSQSVVTA